jgi:hypothetical protein
LFDNPLHKLTDPLSSTADPVAMQSLPLELDTLAAVSIERLPLDAEILCPVKAQMLAPLPALELSADIIKPEPVSETPPERPFTVKAPTELEDTSVPLPRISTQPFAFVSKDTQPPVPTPLSPVPMQTEPLPSHPADEPDDKHKLPLLPPSDAPVTMLTSPLAPTPQTISAETRATAPLPAAPVPLLTKVLPVPLTNLAPLLPWQIKPPPSLHSDTSPLCVFSLDAPAHTLMLPLLPSVFTPLRTANWPLEPLADAPDWTCT